MNSSDFRKEARNKLTGKWGKAALISLAYAVIVLIISFIENHTPESIESIVSLIFAIIEIPLSFGLTLSLFKLYNNNDTKAFDFFSLGFQNFTKAWSIAIRVFLKMILPLILLFVSIFLLIGGTISSTGITLEQLTSGLDVDTITITNTGFNFAIIIGFILYIVSIVWLIIRSYSYQLSYIIACDNENLSAKEAVENSSKLMNGNRWKLFCLQLSFIGWVILACITFGIGFLWLAPYIQFALFAFYKALNEDNTNSVEITKDDMASTEE